MSGPLFGAIGTLEVADVRALVAANPTLLTDKDTQGRTPLDYAIALVNSYPTNDTYLDNRAKLLDIMETLIANGAPLTEINRAAIENQRAYIATRMDYVQKKQAADLALAPDYIYPVDANGDCLFLAIADQEAFTKGLTLTNAELQTRADELRGVAMSEIRKECAEHYGPTITAAEVRLGEDSTLEQRCEAYTRKYGRSGEYGGNHELVALAHALNVTIDVVNAGTQHVTTFPALLPNATKYRIVFYGEDVYAHYDSIRSVANDEYEYLVKAMAALAIHLAGMPVPPELFTKSAAPASAPVSVPASVSASVPASVSDIAVATLMSIVAPAASSASSPASVPASAASVPASVASSAASLPASVASSSALTSSDIAVATLMSIVAPPASVASSTSASSSPAAPTSSPTSVPASPSSASSPVLTSSDIAVATLMSIVASPASASSSTSASSSLASVPSSVPSSAPSSAPVLTSSDIAVATLMSIVAVASPSSVASSSSLASPAPVPSLSSTDGPAAPGVLSRLGAWAASLKSAWTPLGRLARRPAVAKIPWTGPILQEYRDRIERCNTESLKSGECTISDLVKYVEWMDKYRQTYAAYAEVPGTYEEVVAAASEQPEIAQYYALIDEYKKADPQRQQIILNKLKFAFADRMIHISDGDEMKDFPVTNPIKAAVYRGDARTTAWGKSSFNIDPLNPDVKDEMFAKDNEIVTRLIPPQLLANRRVVTAILESLWYCGSKATLDSNPHCFPTRFLAKLRQLAKPEGDGSGSGPEPAPEPEPGSGPEPGAEPAPEPGAGSVVTGSAPGSGSGEVPVGALVALTTAGSGSVEPDLTWANSAGGELATVLGPNTAPATNNGPLKSALKRTSAPKEGRTPSPAEVEEPPEPLSALRQQELAAAKASRATPRTETTVEPPEPPSALRQTLLATG